MAAMNHSQKRHRLMRAAFFFAAACALAPTAYAAKHVSQQDIQLAQQYVMASCIIGQYSGQDLSQEAQGWAGGVLEHSDFSMEQYRKLAELGSSAKSASVSMSGRAMKMQTCFGLAVHDQTKKRIKQILQP